jgi:hypothetical protein
MNLSKKDEVLKLDIPDIICQMLQIYQGYTFTTLISEGWNKFWCMLDHANKQAEQWQKKK